MTWTYLSWPLFNPLQLDRNFPLLTGVIVSSLPRAVSPGGSGSLYRARTPGTSPCRVQAGASASTQLPFGHFGRDGGVASDVPESSAYSTGQCELKCYHFPFEVMSLTARLSGKVCYWLCCAGPVTAGCHLLRHAPCIMSTSATGQL